MTLHVVAVFEQPFGARALVFGISKDATESRNIVGAKKFNDFIPCILTNAETLEGPRRIKKLMHMRYEKRCYIWDEDFTLSLSD